MNRTKLPIRKRLGDVPQFSRSTDAAIAEWDSAKFHRMSKENKENRKRKMLLHTSGAKPYVIFRQGEEITKEGKQAATPGSGGKKNDQNEVELTPPKNQAPPPPITAVNEQAAMTYLEGLADQMNEINTWISRVERCSGRNDKGKAHRLKVSQRSWKGKIPQKRLIHDFEDATTETKQKIEASHEEEDIPQGHDERGSQISKRSGQKPSSSQARLTSVLDRVGKKLKRRQRTSPWREEQRRRRDNHEEESQVRAGGGGRCERPQGSHHSSKADGDREGEVVRVRDLRWILDEME
ncbi:hypothetical protein AgCh_034073 [Apium graveolens]